MLSHDYDRRFSFGRDEGEGGHDGDGDGDSDDVVQRKQVWEKGIPPLDTQCAQYHDEDDDVIYEWKESVDDGMGTYKEYKSDEKSLETIYDRKTSMDLIANNNIFQFAAATPSSNDKDKICQNPQSPWSEGGDHYFQNLSYSLSPSPLQCLPQRAQNENVDDLMSPYTNATSTTNTFDVTQQEIIAEARHEDTMLIPQPRASLIEKTFKWKDHLYDPKIPMPCILSRDEMECYDISSMDAPAMQQQFILAKSH